MRFGLTILTEYPWSVAETMWRETEAMGFDHGWTFDHVIWGGLPESPWFAAVPTLAAVAAVTDRLALGTFVSSPNNHHPVQFMREVLALDDISGGRLLLGLGTGGNVDAGLMGEDLSLKDRVARFHEFTDLLDRLLSSDHVSHEGRFYTARDVRTLPGPVRGGAASPSGTSGTSEAAATTDIRVPLIIAANGPKSIRLAAERGDAWMTYGGNVDSDPEWWALVGRLSESMNKALAVDDREQQRSSPFGRYLNLDAAPTFSLTSVGAFEDAVGRAAALGFTDVITHWPRAEGPFAGQRSVLEAVVSDVLPRWRGEHAQSAQGGPHRPEEHDGPPG